MNVFPRWLILEAANLFILLALVIPNTSAQETEAVPDPKEVRAVLDKAVAYFKTSQGQDASA